MIRTARAELRTAPPPIATFANASASSDAVPVRDRRGGSTTRRRADTAGSPPRRPRDRPAAVIAAPPNGGRPDASACSCDELAHLIDGRDAAQVALALRVAPREQAVAAEDDAVAARIARRPRGAASAPARSRAAATAPRRSGGRSCALNSSSFVRAVRARRERDRPVGMQVIDVVERQKRVQRRVDRRGDAVLAERAQRIVRRPSRLRALRRDSARSAPRACPGRARQTRLRVIDRRSPPLPLTASTRVGSPGQRIGQLELRAGVAAAEIGDAQVGAEQVRAIAQQFERVSVECAASRHPTGSAEISCRGQRSGTSELQILAETLDSARPSDRRSTARSVRPGTTDR